MKDRHRTVSGAVALLLLPLLVLSIAIACAHQKHHARSAPSTSRGVVATRDPESYRDLSHLPATPEVRAMWVVRSNMISPAQINHVVAAAKRFGFNALFVQVRGRGDAYYHSTLEPRAEELSSEPASFDPLAYAIQTAHAKGIQVHAWLNTDYVWGAGRKPYSAEHIVNAHPDWLMRDVHGNYSLSATGNCEGAFTSPSNAAVRQHVHDVFLEVAKNYDIDGIHFDYIRYPNQNYDYSDAAIGGFKAYMDQRLTTSQKQSLAQGRRLAYVRAFPGQWVNWRRDQVTSLVASISHDVKAIKPWVIVSAAVYADYKDAYSSKGQDWKAWLREGLLDVVVPMAYGSSTEKVAAQIQDAEHAAKEYHRFCYAGLGSWHISAASTEAKIEAARAAGAQGIVLFSYGGVTKDGTQSAYLQNVDASSFQRRAVLPNLSWLPSNPNGQLASAAP
ncbi:MAG TPA: family 10 glycosylhydrolase [Capsulimonadaceae bacterium]|nr:family 10 glycosylhydrolase [Capsulimonadaceae bacterium]